MEPSGTFCTRQYIDDNEPMPVSFTATVRQETDLLGRSRVSHISIMSGVCKAHATTHDIRLYSFEQST